MGALFLHQLAPLLLDLEGTLTLHASAVSREETTVLFHRPSGSGKSTLAAALEEQPAGSWKLVSDDVAALEFDRGRWLVHPGAPEQRLWPDSARHVFPAGRPRATACRDDGKVRVARPELLSASPRAVTVVCRLVMAEEAGWQKVPPAVALKGLLASVFRHPGAGRERRAEELKQLASLTEAVCSFDLLVPTDYTLLPDVRGCLDDLLASAASG